MSRLMVGINVLVMVVMCVGYNLYNSSFDFGSYMFYAGLITGALSALLMHWYFSE